MEINKSWWQEGILITCVFLHYRLWPLHSILFWKRIETSWLSSLPLEQIYMQHFFGWKRPFRRANRLKFLALDFYELLEKIFFMQWLHSSWTTKNFERWNWNLMWPNEISRKLLRCPLEGDSQEPRQSFISGYKLLQLQELSLKTLPDAEFKKSNHRQAWKIFKKRQNICTICTKDHFMKLENTTPALY